MATGEVDQKVLAYIARDCLWYNPALSEAFRTVLGISIMLSPKLLRARKLRRLDRSRDTRSLDLYHEILWLAKEGLALTEIDIMPFCQGPDSRRLNSVMAARLMATFHHIFSLYQNDPPLNQRRQWQPEHFNGLENPWMKQREDPESDYMGSEASFVTNLFPTQEASPPPLYPNTSWPTDMPRKAPARPPGLDVTADYKPPTCAATFLLDAKDYVPEVKQHFERAIKLAEALLYPGHPLRLSVVLEYATFLFESLEEYDASQKLCKRAILAVHGKKRLPTADVVFDDTHALIDQLAELAQKGEAKLGIGEHTNEPKKPVARPSPHIISPPLYPPPTRELPATPRQRADSTRNNDLATPGEQTTNSSSGGVPLGPVKQLHGLGITYSPGSGGAFNGISSRSGTLVGSPIFIKGANGKLDQSSDERILKEKESKRSRTSIKSSKSARRRTEGTGTEKERKRRAVQRAEEELMRKRSGTSQASTIIHTSYD